uniref:CSON001813 protein n=1 Tax=Culicoides sonorensis TaxID=179676 RepID=A0A336LRE5_CULSO
MSDYIDVYLLEKKLKVIIFNHTYFLNEPEKQRTLKIGEKVYECLRKLGNIEIEHVKSREEEILDENGAMHRRVIHDDLMAANVLNLMKTVSENGDSYSGLIVFVSSHGGMGMIGGEFCEFIQAHDKSYRKSLLWECFLDKPGWKGKPLMFFFQACRGGDATPGVRMSIDASGISDVRIFPDLFIMNATLPGAVAFKSDQNSIFADTLCSEISKNAHHLDLNSIALNVCKEVAQTFESCDMLEPKYYCSQQMPCIESTFTKYFFFSTKYQPHPKKEHYYESVQQPFILFLNYDNTFDDTVEDQTGEIERIRQDTRFLVDTFEKIGYGSHVELNATFERYKELTAQYCNLKDKNTFMVIFNGFGKQDYVQMANEQIKLHKLWTELLPDINSSELANEKPKVLLFLGKSVDVQINGLSGIVNRSCSQDEGAKNVKSCVRHFDGNKYTNIPITADMLLIFNYMEDNQQLDGASPFVHHFCKVLDSQKTNDFLKAIVMTSKNLLEQNQTAPFFFTLRKPLPIKAN